MSRRGVFDRSILIDNGQVVAALGILEPMSGDIYRHLVVVQYGDGTAALAWVGELVSGEKPEIVKRFDTGAADWNRTAAMQAMLEDAGYARMADDDCP